MNLFVLSTSPIEAADMHCDAHTIKMILEYAQMLSTAHLLLDGERVIDRILKSGKPKYKFVHPLDSVLYKKTHENHPSSIWVRSDHKAYEYTYQMFMTLCSNYSYSTGKIHATWTKLGNILRTPPKFIPHNNFSAPPKCMPDEYKTGSDSWYDVVESYRVFYSKSKSRFATFGKYNNPEPEWYNGKL